MRELWVNISVLKVISIILCCCFDSEKQISLCFQDSPRKHVGGHHEVKAVQQTRRLLANARERTRVHTISAAFEALRKQVRLSDHTKTHKQQFM